MTYKNVHSKIRVDRGVKKKVFHHNGYINSKIGDRCELKEENLALLRLTIFLTIFLLFSMVEI